MDCRLCCHYKRVRFEGAQVPVDYCMWYQDGLTEIKGDADKHAELCLYRNGKIEVKGASGCDHYKEKEFSIAEFVTNWVIPGIIYGCIIFVILSILFYFLRYVFNLFS
jgi:hypothetical protein